MLGIYFCRFSRKNPLLFSCMLWSRKGDGDRENLSQLFQDYYSAVTSHFTHSGDRELAGRRAAKGLCRKTHTCSEHFLFLTQEDHGVEDKRCVELATWGTTKCNLNFGVRFLYREYHVSALRVNKEEIILHSFNKISSPLLSSPLLCSCHTGTNQVQVLITDENDCVPEFLQSIYSVDGVPETVTTATSLLQGKTPLTSYFISICLVLEQVKINENKLFLQKSNRFISVKWSKLQYRPWVFVCGIQKEISRSFRCVILILMYWP